MIVLIPLPALLKEQWRQYVWIQPPAPTGKVEDADVFIALGFGARKVKGELSAGESNLAIAKWLIETNTERKPTITQRGVYLGLKTCEQKDPTLRVDEWVINLPHYKHFYVDTRGAAIQSGSIVQDNGFQRAVLVSHPLQLQRAAWIFQKVLDTELIIPEMPSIPFDPDSIQPWTRSKTIYILFEWFLARPRLLLGNLMSSVHQARIIPKT